MHVLNLYFSGNSMNNLSSYFGLTDSRMRASDTDLPVMCMLCIVLIEIVHRRTYNHTMTLAVIQYCIASGSNKVSYLINRMH